MQIGFKDKDGNPIQGKGLLIRFIKDRVNNYIPSTKKKSKGAFSPQKFAAAILMLTSLHTSKEIAKILDISYGLIRKWRTEWGFKNLIYQYGVAFTDLFINHYKKQSIEKGFNSSELHEAIREDCSLFSPWLGKRILEELGRPIKEMTIKKKISSPVSFGLLQAVLIYTARNRQEELSTVKLFTEAYRPILSDLADISINLLEKRGRLSAGERELISDAISTLKRHVEISSRLASIEPTKIGMMTKDNPNDKAKK